MYQENYKSGRPKLGNTGLILGLGIIALVFAGCDATDTVGLEEELEQVIYEMARAYETKDLDRYMGFFSEDYLEIDNAGTPEDKTDDRIIRYEDLRRSTETFFNEVEQIELKISGLEIKMGIHPTACTFARVSFYEEIQYKPQGKEKITKASEKKYTFYRKEGRWLVGPPVETIYVPLQSPEAEQMQKILQKKFAPQTR